MGLRFEDIEKKTPEHKKMEEFIENVSSNSKCKLKVCIYILIINFIVAHIWNVTKHHRFFCVSSWMSVQIQIGFIVSFIPWNVYTRVFEWSLILRHTQNYQNLRTLIMWKYGEFKHFALKGLIFVVYTFLFFIINFISTFISYVLCCIWYG